VIPAWNAAGTITRALESVLSGATATVECVVVDDGSTDGTADVVAALAALDPRVVLVRAPENGGASAARNLGLAAAQGEWLTFLDSDDVLLPRGLDALLRGAADGGIRAVVGQRVWTDGTKRWITAAYDRPDIRTPSRRTSLVERPGLLSYASATGKLFHHSVAEGLQFEGRVLGDQPWTIRALLRAGDDIAVIGDVVYEWRRGAASGTSSITAAKRSSARLAAEAARVAVRAFGEVREEAALQLSDPVARQVVVASYFERLVELDLAGAVRRAVARRDAGTAELFAAIEAFVLAAPADVVRGSRALAEAILRPPLDAWLLLPQPAKTAYVGLLRSIDAANPGLVEARIGRGPLGRAVRLLLASEQAPRWGLATLLLAPRLPVFAVRMLGRPGPRRQPDAIRGASPR
jgi:hypothetical protein